MSERSSGDSPMSPVRQPNEPISIVVEDER
jgi:hypothetical protein